MSIGEEYMSLLKKKKQEEEVKKKQEWQKAYDNSSDVAKEYMQIRQYRKQMTESMTIKPPSVESMPAGARMPFDLSSDPYGMKDAFAKWKEDSPDEYLAYVDYQNKLKYDLTAGQKKIDDLNRAMELAKAMKKDSYSDPSANRHARREYQRILENYGLTGEDDLKELISAETVMFNQSKWTQQEAEMASVVNNPDFMQYSQMGAGMQNPSYEDANGHGYFFGWRPGADEIKNKVTFARENAELLQDELKKQHKNNDTPFVVDPIYRHVTEEEAAIYNYYLAKYGEDKAEEYLQSLQDKLNQREAGKVAEFFKGNTFAEITYAANAGIDQFRSGAKGLGDLVTGNEEYRAPSAIQYADQIMREDLADNGPKIFGSSLGQIAHDALSTTANMAPSILASYAVGMLNPTAGKVVGSALLGASAAGNAYQQKLNEGYSKEQARTYGLMVGASESIMEALLGGISQLGGGVLSKTVLKNLSKLDNVLGKVAQSAVGKVFMNATSEAIEEGLQSILEPHLWQIVSGADYSIESQEVLYSALLGFITGGVFEGANASFKTVARNIDAKQRFGAKQGDITATALELNPDSKFAQRMQSRLDNGKNLSGSQLNRLLKQIGSDITADGSATVREESETIGAEENSQHSGLDSMTDEHQEIANEIAKALSESDGDIDIAKEHSDLFGDPESETMSEPATVDDVDHSNVAPDDIELGAEFAEIYKDLLSDAETDLAEANTSVEITEDSAASDVDPLPTGEISDADSTISEGVQESSTAPDTSVSLEQASRKYGAQAKAMMATYNQGQDVARFDRAYKIAYDMGQVSPAMMRYALNSEATSYLTPEQIRHAVNAGMAATDARDSAIERENKAKGKVTTRRKEGTVKVEGEASEFREALKDPKDPRRNAIKTLMTIAKATGVNIVLTMSKVDSKGRFVGDQGQYRWSDDTIFIDINSGLKYESDIGEISKYAMLRTFGHEFTHFLEKNSPKQYSEFRDFVFSMMTARGENVDHLIRKKQTEYENISYEAASREVVAESMTDILRDSKYIAQLEQQNMGLFQKLLSKLKEFVASIKSQFAALAPNPSLEAKAIQDEIGDTMKYLDSIVEKFDKLAADAVENYQQRVTGEDVVSELTPGEEGVVVAEDGEPVAYSTEDGTVMLSIRTYEDEGRSAFRAYLEKCVKNKSLTEAEMTEMLDGIEEVYNICKKFKDQYAPFSAWSDAEVIRDTHGKPVFSVVTPNGEYKMNLDFSLVCKKRRALDAVLNEMCKRGIIDNFELGPKTIVKINELIRKNKLETACSLCFVDAKRFRQADVADSVVRLYNELVQSLVPEEHSRSIDHFNFAGYRTITPTENGIHTWPNSKLDFSHINEVLKQYGKNTVEAKAARYIKNNPEARRLLLRGDFMSSSGFDAVKTQNPNIMKIYNSKKGTGGPKAAFGDVQYMNEIISNNKSWTPEKAYDVGGVRIQSFSDYVPRMVFDYVQMVYDLAAKKLPAHAYTKEALFVMQFGLTGIKINMSLIPAIVDGGIAPGLDANGDYAWAGESFDFETAKTIQKAPGYSENCGTIAVGVSYEHIVKLLDDPDIRMVIPYHKSSLNPIVAHMNRIGEYTDYTKPGKTPVEHGGQRTTDKNGKTIEHEFNFAKTLHEVGDPKAVADQYLAWCGDRYTPKFDEFKGHENYYKLLTDFTVYDKSGTYVPQREVKAVFPKKGNKFGEMEKLIESGLKGDAIIQSKRDSLIPKIVDEIERTIARTEAEISDDEQVEQADHDVEAELMDEDISTFYDSHAQRSVRVYDEDTLEFLNNQKTIKTYKTMQLIDGKLYPPMAARTEGQYEDYSVLGEWEQATEHPELIKNGKYKLDKGKGQGSIEAAYNPYMHSSDLPINDQFTSAYKRDNLVTVECEVPDSEMTSGYHAQYAKDSVGWHSWHTGTVAGAIRKARGIERRVFLSRWIKPVRIIPDSEVASMYKELLSGTDIAIPDNVVTPSLLNELKKQGVATKSNGAENAKTQYSKRTYDSVEEMDSDYLDAVDSGDVKTQQQMVAEAAKRSMPDTVVVDTKGDPMLMYHGTANGGAFTVFEGNKLSNESRTSQIGQGFYFTNSKADAEAYTKNVDIYGRASKGSNPHLHQVYLNITNPFDVRNDTLDLDKVKSVYMDGGYDYFYDNWIPFYLDKKSVNGRTFTKADLKAMSREERVSAFVDYYSKLGSKEVLSNMVRAFGSQNQGALLDSMKTRLGYDGIVEEYKPGLFQYVAFSSEQIKSAEPVTYDDSGNVIPLSERFNDGEADIRYQKRTNTLTDHEILDMAAKELDTSKLTDGEKAALEIFRKKNDALKALKEERKKQGSLYYQYQFGDQKDAKKATEARNRMTVLDGKITKASAEVLGIEDKKVLKDVLQKSRKVIEQHERKASIERVKAAREEARVKERKIANEKLEALRQKKNERIAEVRAEERERAAERVQTVREGYQSSRLREKIKAFKAKLEKNLLNPTERQYVPAGLTQAMIDVVNLIDIDTDLINEDGTVNKAQERRNETKMKLSDLAAEYERLKSSDPVYAGEFDETVYNYLTELRDNFAGRHLREMTLGELTEMYEILRSIEETLQDARKLIGWGDAETVYEAGDSIIAEQASITAKRKGGKRTWVQEKRDNSLALTLSPVRYVERMSGYHQNSYLLRMFKAFERGIRKKNMFKMEAYKTFEVLTSRQQFEDAVYIPAGKTYTDANGRKFRLSKMQMMQAILSLEREQANNMSHIEGSGFSFADLEMLKKGKLGDAISEEHSHRVPNAVEMVGEFVDLLKNDKFAQDYMAAARKFFNETAKDAINETSLALKHRIVAKDKAYIPFEVDKNFIVNEISAANDVQQTINSYGMLKDTKKFASNPLIITGLNNILDRHIEQVGNIYGLAIEVRNFNKVWNVRGLEADSGDPTVKATIQRNWGDKGLKLVEQAVQDIQGPRHNSQSAIYKKIKSGYIGATFLLNLSVVTKQVGSLFSATSMLNWRGPVRQIGNLVYTMTNSKKLSAEVDKYTASAWMRRQGLSDAEVYTLMTEGKRTWMGRLANKAPAAINPTKWITAMDHAVALSLWKYAKQDTAKRTGLKGEELLKATAEFYDEVVENTQSMTDVLHRPEIQKRSDVISESFGMFKTDLYQMAGQLLVTGERYHANKTKENGKALARTAYAVTMSAVWAQLMTTVFALLRYKVDQYRDDEDEDLTVKSWMKRQSFSLVGDLVGYIFPMVGSELAGVAENVIYGESDELVDSLGLSAINNTYDAIIKVCAPLADGELPKTSDLRKLTTNALQMFGVPANNILRALDAIQLHAKDIANGEFMSFEAGVQRSSGHHAHRIMEAVQKGDMDLANALFEEAVEEAALKKSEDGSISDEALKDAQSSLQTAFGKKYKDGEISAEQAEKILVELFGKSEDDAYWTIKAWDNGGDSRYSAVFDAALSGTGFNEAVKEMTDHGYEKDDILSKLKTQVKAWYTDEESEVRITKQQATEMLRKYVGMNADDVTSTINQWSCKVVTGIAYEDIKGEFLAGNMTASRAIDMRVRYGGKSREDAQKEVEGWNFEKKYGFSYSDRKNAYINGEVSASELRNAMTTYGGMTAEEADENIRAYDWLKSHPKYDLSVSDVIAYTKPIADIGKSIEQTGITPDVYMKYKDLRSKCKGVDANGDGKTDSGSVKTEVLKAIDSLPISASQKDALYYLNGWSKSKIWEAPWH